MPETTHGKRFGTDVRAQEFADHVILTPPDRLREKAVRDARPLVARDADPVTRAENALALLAHEFETWMEMECDALAAAREAVAHSRDLTDIGAVFRAAHDIRGQAATLGFPLAGEIADGLCTLIERMGDRPAPIEVVDRHVEAIRAVVRERVRDRDHQLGAALARRLAEMRGALIPSAGD